MPVSSRKGPAHWRLQVGKSVGWFLGAIVASLVVQVFLAGAGLLGPDADYLDMHALWANTGIRIPYLLLIIAGFLGADWRMGVVGVVLMALLEAQFFLIDASAAEVRGLHAANGSAMIAIAAIALMRRLPWAPLGPTRAPAATPARAPSGAAAPVTARPSAARPIAPAARPPQPPMQR